MKKKVKRGKKEKGRGDSRQGQQPHHLFCWIQIHKMLQRSDFPAPLQVECLPEQHRNLPLVFPLNVRGSQPQPCIVFTLVGIMDGCRDVLNTNPLPAVMQEDNCCGRWCGKTERLTGVISGESRYRCETMKCLGEATYNFRLIVKDKHVYFCLNPNPHPFDWFSLNILPVQSLLILGIIILAIIAACSVLALEKSKLSNFSKRIGY